MFFLISFLFTFIGSSQVSISYYQNTGDINQVSDLKEVTFTEIDDVNLGVDNGTYWFKIEGLDLPRSIIELQTPHVDQVSLIDNTGKEIHLMKDTRYPSFFVMGRTVTYPLYLKANFPLEANFPIKVLDEQEFATNEKVSLLGIGFFYGTTLALLLATLIFLIITKNKQFLFYGILITAIYITVMTRDNILYFFNAKPRIISSIELFGHFLVGLLATGYVFRYLKIKKHQQLIRYTFVTLSTVSAISLFIFWLLTPHWSFILTDFITIITVVLLWCFTIYYTKNTNLRIIMSLIYIMDIIIMIDAFLLHDLGLSLLKLSSFQLGLVALINFTLIALSLIFSFRRIQAKTVIMKHQIKMHLERLSQLDNYKNVQDSNDQYIESLIGQFQLENIEVKVLDSISKGLTNERIATKHNLSGEKLKIVTSSLYRKLGIESDQEAASLLT